MLVTQEGHRPKMKSYRCCRLQIFHYSVPGIIQRDKAVVDGNDAALYPLEDSLRITPEG